MNALDQSKWKKSDEKPIEMIMD